MIWIFPRLSLEFRWRRRAKVRRSYHLPVARGKPATVAQEAQKSHKRRTGNPQTAGPSTPKDRHARPPSGGKTPVGFPCRTNLTLS